MKIYTRGGDDGTTGVLGHDRLLKSDPRIEAYGTVDELNAALGVARVSAAGSPLADDLAALQRRMFQVGAELATTDARMLEQLSKVTDADTTEIEALIDRLEAALPPLRQFVLPGGIPLAAHLHTARTICRRAERRVVALARAGGVDPPSAGALRLVRFLNRVADLLFVMARSANHSAGVADEGWMPPAS